MATKKNQTSVGGFRQFDTPPVSEGPQHFGAHMVDSDGTVLTDGKGNWIGPISRLAPEFRKYVKNTGAAKKSAAKTKKK